METKPSIGRVLALICGLTALTSCHHPDPTDPTPHQALDSNRTLWTASDIPQVGAIVRLTFADDKHTLVSNAVYEDAGVSSQYVPAMGSTSNEKTTISNKASINLGLSFVAKRAPSANADAHDVSELTIIVTGEKVAQWKSKDDLQQPLRRFDGKGSPKGSPTHELYGKINKAGDDERMTKAVTPYWVVTKVFTGKSVEISALNSKGASADLACGSGVTKCIIPAVKLSAGMDLASDKQHLVDSADRPIFVVIKPLTTNSDGNVTIETDSLAPGVITD